MLAHQLPTLSPFEIFWSSLPEFFAWVECSVVSGLQVGMPIADGERVLRTPTLGRVGGPGKFGVLEIIRFSAANRLCVDLDYCGSVRRIESYSLRLTCESNLVLHAIRSDTGKHQSYRVDRMQGAKPTNRIFVAKYEVELAPSVPLPVSSTPMRRDSRGSSRGMK